MMTHQLIPAPFWNSTPIGRSIDLCLCQFPPQLILEDKALYAAIRFQYNSFIGTLISDDESQRLIYVIDRLRARDTRHQLLTGEFLVPIQFDKDNSTVRNSLIQDQIKTIDLYCRSSSLIELHRFAYLCGQISSHDSSSIDLSFDLLTIKNSFTLTPVDPVSVHIVPTALFKTLNSSTENSIYHSRPHFGYCAVDRMSHGKLFLILENDPQACALPLVGIWISGISDIQCAFVWSVCLRYCLNCSLKQRLRSGINAQQSFLLACYSPSSYGQCSFYQVHSISLLALDYDLWTCSKQIPMADSSAEFPYDFQFKRVDDQPKDSPSVTNHSNDHQQPTFASPNTNGSLFGFPRIPPKQFSHPSPSWDTPGTTPINTPTRRSRPPMNSPESRQFSSPIRSTAGTVDNGWKEEFTERMKSYESQIQSLTALVTQLLTTQQNSPSPAGGERMRRDVGVQSPILSPNRIGKPSSMTEHRQSQTSLLDPIDRSSSPPIVHEEETMIDYSSLHRPSLVPTDVNPVDILKPIFQFIDNQQQKQQQGSASSLMTTYNSTDADRQTENMLHVANAIQQQQQHVTSTTTTGISFISNGVQMQFINQQSSTTTLYPQSQQSTPRLPISPQRSENSLSVEVHGLEMKYLEDDQLAAAIECDRQSETPQVVDKSLSFGTQEYLQRYGLFTESNPS